jgi:hypothetical protein
MSQQTQVRVQPQTARRPAPRGTDHRSPSGKIRWAN